MLFKLTFQDWGFLFGNILPGQFNTYTILHMATSPQALVPTTRLPWPGSYNKDTTNQVTLTSLFPILHGVSEETDHFNRQFHIIHFTVIRLGPFIRLCFCLLTRPWPLWPLTPRFSEQVPIHAVFTWPTKPSTYLMLTFTVCRVWHTPHQVEMSMTLWHTMKVVLPISVKTHF